MPTYQVHVAKEGKSFDPEAVELPDTKTAKRHAKTLAEGLTALSRGFGVGSLRERRRAWRGEAVARSNTFV